MVSSPAYHWAANPDFFVIGATKVQLLKKVVSLLLVVAMLGSFTLVASADDGDSSADKVVLKLLVSDENWCR